MEPNQQHEPGIWIDEGSAREFILLPEGAHLARCYCVVDTGTQKESYQGEDKFLRKVRVFWEVPEETVTIEGVTKPMAISKEFTASLNEKSNLRKTLISWRGRAFTPEELKGFDLKKLLGAQCVITITHNLSKAGKKYAAVSAVSTPTKGVVVPPQVNPSLWFSVTMGKGHPTFALLPEWIQKVCNECNEWVHPPEATPAEPEVEIEDSDSVPF